jgi:hypothetical protein
MDMDSKMNRILLSLLAICFSTTVMAADGKIGPGQILGNSGTTADYAKGISPTPFLLPHVANNTALKAQTGGYATYVIRDGYAAVGDGGAVKYKWSGTNCSLNAGAGDNGSQVAPNAGGGCWIADFQGHPNVIAWGADPTGVSTSDASIAAAASALSGSGQRLEITPGKYLLTGAAPITLSHIEIACLGAPSDETVATADYGKIGATFLVTSTTVTPFAAGSGWRIHDCNFLWPNQIESPTAPIVYPPLIAGSAIANAVFDNNTVINAYDFFLVTTPGFGAGDVSIHHNHIFALRRFLDVENGVPDVVTISDNFITYGVYEGEVLSNGAATTYLRDYATANSVLVYVNNGSASHPSMDGLSIHHNLVFGYRYGVYVASGLLDLPTIDGNKFDNTQTVLSVQGTSTLSHATFTANEVYSYRIGYTSTCNPVFDLQSTGAVVSTLLSSGNFYSFSRGHVFYFNNNTSFKTFQSTGDHIESWGQCGTNAERVAFALTDSQLIASVSGDIIRATASGSNTFTAFSLNLSSANIVGNTIIGTSINARTIAGSIKLSDNVATTTATSSIVDTTGTPSTVLSTNNSWDKTPTIYNTPSFMAVIAVAQTFTGAKTQAVFGTSLFDDGGNVSSSTFTAPWAGIYECKTEISYTSGATATDVWKLSIEPSVAAIKAAYKTIYANDGAGSIILNSTFHLGASETVGVYVTRTSGSGNLVEASDATSSFFSCKQIE